MIMKIVDPIGRTLDFFTKLQEKLTRSGLDVMWDEEDSKKILLKEVVKKIPDLVRKKVNEEAQRSPKVLKNDDKFFQAVEK